MSSTFHSTSRAREDSIVVIYDGECPFCSSYVRLARLREAAGSVRLVDARSADPEVERAKSLGYDLDEGMIVAIGGATYFGAEAMRMLTAMSTPSRAFNRLMKLLFTSPRSARFVYPVLRCGRNVMLALLGRGKIGASRR